MALGLALLTSARRNPAGSRSSWINILFSVTTAAVIALIAGTRGAQRTPDSFVGTPSFWVALLTGVLTVALAYVLVTLRGERWDRLSSVLPLSVVGTAVGMFFYPFKSADFTEFNGHWWPECVFVIGVTALVPILRTRLKERRALEDQIAVHGYPGTYQLKPSAIFEKVISEINDAGARMQGRLENLLAVERQSAQTAADLRRLTETIQRLESDLPRRLADNFASALKEAMAQRIGTAAPIHPPELQIDPAIPEAAKRIIEAEFARIVSEELHPASPKKTKS